MKCRDSKKTMSIKKERIDPTSLLPEEEMAYELKPKRKKKKKKKKDQDPFKDLTVEQYAPVEIHYDPEDTELIVEQNAIEPDVKIKVEDIDDLDFNQFAPDDNHFGDNQYDSIDEPQVKLENQKQEGAILTYETIPKDEDSKEDIKPNIRRSIRRPVKRFNKDGRIKRENERVNCKICFLSFKNESTLVVHLNKKHNISGGSFIYKCKICGLTYEQRNSLRVHMLRKHDPNKKPEDLEQKSCEICCLVFKGASRLRLHMQRQHGNFYESYKHRCEDCGLTYEKYCSLVTHRKRKHSNINVKKEVEIFKCSICPDRTYTNRDTYARHLERLHSDKDEITPELHECIKLKNEITGEVPCKHCPLVFKNIGALKLHLKRKHNECNEYFPVKCIKCFMSFRTPQALKTHIRRRHFERLYCKICEEKFPTKEEFENHEHKRKILQCVICGLIFPSENNLNKHMTCTHKIAGPGTIECHLCDRKFKTKTQRDVHVSYDHFNVRYPCTICRRSFKSRFSLQYHWKKIHPELSQSDYSKFKQPCHVCPEIFTKEADLSKHIHSVHTTPADTPDTSDVKIEVKTEEKVPDEVKLAYQCTQCPEKYDTWDLLRKHYSENHKIVQNIQCTVCGDFVPDQELSKHMRTAHPVNKMTKCPYCDFETNSRSSLSQHTLRHKNATTIPCEYPGCRYKSYYPLAMERHMQKHEQIGAKFQCASCPFQTMNKYILRYHEEEHATGKKRYQCDQCDYATILPMNLVTHKYKHSTEKRFKCEFCTFATKYNTSLRFHVKTKHCDLGANASD